MKRWFIVCAAALIASTALSAQEPNYELADRFSAKKVSNMVFSTAVTPHYFKNSDKFWYQWKDSKGVNYYIVDPVAGTKRKIFDPEKLAMQISEITKDPFDAQHLPLSDFKLKDDTKFTFKVECKQMVDTTFRFEYHWASGKLENVSADEEVKDYPYWAIVSPDGTKAVYKKNYNLYWMSVEDLGKLRKDEKDSTVVEHQITFDGEHNFGYGTDSYRDSEVSDTTKRSMAAISWSPDSRHFAITRYDLRPLKDLWLINSLSMPRPTLVTYKYQMPGEPCPAVSLYVFDIDTGEREEIDVSAFKDQEISIMDTPSRNSDVYDEFNRNVWLGDAGKFYIERRSRDLKRYDVCAVDIAADTVITIIEERLNTYVESREMKLVNGGKELIWWSERNGWANLYLYGTDGTLKNNITNGSFHVESILSVDEKARVVYFLAMGVNKDENPYNGHVYRVNFDGTGMKQIDNATGFNSTGTAFSDNSKYFVNNYSSVDHTPENALMDNTGRKIMQLEEADLSLLFQAGYKFPEPFKVKAADGITDLYGYMYKPFDFDSTKSYPIIDYVYPGPQVEGNFENWTKSFTRTDRLAQIGFIVITVGNRGGHPNRSKWYHNYGYGNLRDYGLEDQKYAIQQLASRFSFIDINRVGIHGHSGGGFMSTAAILSYPDFFKVAVSCAGNHDNSIYNRWWSEQHHGILEEITADGDTTFKYSIDTNQELAGNLKGHLLLVHGDNDDNVSMSNTIRVVNALIRANKRFDMLILPGQAHGFGDMNEYFFWRMADYYSEWLLGSSHRNEVDIKELNND